MFSLWSNIWSQRGITRKDALHMNIAHQTSASKCLSIKSQFCLRKDKRLHSKCFSLLTRHSNRLVVVSSHQREQQLKWWRSRKIRIGGKQTHFSLNKTSIQSFLSLARKIKKVKNGILQTWYYALQLSLGEVCMECMVMVLCTLYSIVEQYMSTPLKRMVSTLCTVLSALKRREIGLDGVQFAQHTTSLGVKTRKGNHNTRQHNTFLGIKSERFLHYHHHRHRE